MGTNATLSWLHLADLQTRRKGARADALLRDIETQLQESEVHPDYIAVTGDVAFSGQWEEYELAAEFFDSLLKRIDVERDRLFIVPGNHDIDRREVELGKGYGDVASTSIAAPDRFILDNYSRFIDEYLGTATRLDISRYAYLRRLDWGGRAIAVVGLNTAWMDPPLKQSLPRDLTADFDDQVKSALNQLREADVAIALLHHSPKSLSGRRGYEGMQALLERCDFVLNAHVHSGRERRIRQGIDRTLTIQGGSDPAREPHPNAYSFVEIDPDRGILEAHFRRYDPERGRWEGDSGAHPEAVDGVYTSRLPERLRALLALGPEGRWSPPLAGYTPDTVSGDDQLGIMSEVEAFSSVIAYKGLRPPLCLGVFGDWGSGKTFFMKKMSEQVSRLAEAARNAGSERQETDYCSHIVQIHFNAWHYVDANLWACLISYIFEELDRFIERAEKKEKRKRLLRELRLATEAEEKAKNKRESAEQRVEAVEKRLKQARRERVETSLKLRDLLAGLSLDRILDEDQRDRLRNQAKELGLPQTYHSVEALNSTLEDTRTLWGRLKVALLAPRNRGLGFLWLLIVLVVIPLVGIVVDRVLNWLGDFPDLVDTVAAVLLQVAAFSASVRGGLNALLKRTSPIVDELESVLVDAQERAEERRQQISEEEAQLLGKLDVLKEREAAASEALAQAHVRVEEAELALQELETVADERRLAEFIQERVASEEYRKHLGIISTIREDLEILSCKLRPSEECQRKGIVSGSCTDEALPSVDRIVLYIDDLDRCPENRVVEVLQAVHLLLAFELFVVVVGVDSRWLLRSLEESYCTLQVDEKARTGWSEEELWAWQSTPQNYLEKIFQIPYNLREMEEDGFRELVGSILPPVAPGRAEVSDSAPLAVDVEREETAPLGLEEDSEKGLGPDGVDADSAEDSADEVGPQLTEAQMGGEEEAPIDLTPEILRIEEVEQAFISQLSAMIPTPRAAKRFVNIYRLIRATVPPEDLSAFVGDPDNPGEHRVAMILLAILTGFSRQAPYVFRKILSLPGDASWSELIDSFRPHKRSDAETLRYRNGIIPRMNIAEAAQWKKLYRVLTSLRHTSDKVSPYARWAPRVARFSFRVGKIESGVDPATDVQITHIELAPSGSGAEGEYVRITNIGDVAQSMTGWTLSDQAGHIFTFSEFALPAGGNVTVWVGEGKDTPTDLHWGRRAPIWNNAGDTATLRDDRGALVSSLTATPDV